MYWSNIDLELGSRVSDKEVRVAVGGPTQCFVLSPDEELKDVQLLL